MGVVTNLVFDGVQMAGQVLSVQMGYSLVNILDPQTAGGINRSGIVPSNDCDADLPAP